VVGLPAENASVRFITLPFADTRKVDQTMAGELADVLPFDVFDACYDHQMIKKTDDGGSMSIAAAAKSQHVQTLLDVCREADVDPKFVPIDVLSLFNLYSHYLVEDATKPDFPSAPADDAGTYIGADPEGPPDARLLLDIGHERSLVCACGPEGVAHVRVIRHGGQEVTSAVASAYGLEWEAAEAGKHEDGQLASSRYPASSDAAQRMSDVVAKGLSPLVRELRRTMQAIRRERRVRIARIDLLGGGARIRNLAPYLAEQLNLPVSVGAAVEQVVEREIDSPRRGAMAQALSLALRPAGESAVSQLDMRKGEFAYAGSLQNFRQRIPFMVASVAVLALLTIISVVARFQALGQREAEVDQQFCDITKKVVGRAICEPSVAIPVLKQPSSELGAFKLPERSAFLVAAEVSSLIPQELIETTVVTEMDINVERARIEGETANFEAVDKLSTALAA
ncbi:MAG: pilus assembly protein PilM, partial [Myxococcota bacterium]